MLKLFAFCTDYSVLKNAFVLSVKPIDETPKPLSITENYENKKEPKYTDMQINYATIIQKRYRLYLYEKIKKCAQSIIMTNIYNYKLRRVKKQLVTLNKFGSKKIYVISFDC